MSNLTSKRVQYAAASAVAVCTSIAVFYYRRKLFRLHHPSFSLPPIAVINNAEQWRAVAEKVKSSCSRKKVIGLDCEWRANLKTTDNNSVALLQLASVHEFCILIRLNKMKYDIPDDLRALLQDSSILKVGVAIGDDAKKLLKDHNLTVQGCLDLRHMVNIPKYAKMESKGLKSLALNLVDVKLHKGNIRVSDWDAPELSEKQIEYAAKDALVAAMIFEHLMSERLATWCDIFTNKQLSSQELYTAAIKEFGHLIDKRFRNSTSPPDFNNSLLKRLGNGLSGKQQTRAYSTRKTPLYHNCQLQAPDGEPLCTCDTKKALWYLEKDLAVLVSVKPLVVRLKFEPSARPTLDNKYYVEEKMNQCVVCGRLESLVRKIVVPHEYRRNFPNLMKNHLSHDVLLLCVECHHVSNAHDGFLRHQLAIECDAPLGSGLASRSREDPQLRMVKSAGRALQKHNTRMPVTRKTELETILKDFYQVSELTDTLINVAADVETNFLNESYVAHGQKVVQHASNHSGLLALESRWRKHFVDTMKPRYLPKMWSVDHNHERLALQVASSKNIDFDINILGLSSSDYNMNQTLR